LQDEAFAWLLLIHGALYLQNTLTCKALLQLGVDTPVDPATLVHDLVLPAFNLCPAAILGCVWVVLREMGVDLLLDVPKNNVISQELSDVLAVLTVIIFILNVEELFIQVEQHLARVHVWAEILDVFLIKHVDFAD